MLGALRSRTDDGAWYNVADSSPGNSAHSREGTVITTSQEYPQPVPTSQPGPTISEAERAHAQELFRELRRRTPYVFVTWVILFACVAVFVAMVANGANVMDPSAADIIRWGGNFGVYTAHGEWWRLFSCMFVHVGLLHIGFNMWVLVNVGRMVERIFGNLPFALLYLLSGVGGSLASLIYYPTKVSAGASGAIFGVFGGLLGILIIERHRFPAFIFHALKRFAVSFVGINVLIGFTVPFIDNAAHIGGLVTGLVCGMVLRRSLPAAGEQAVDESAFSFLRRWAGAIVLSGLLYWGGVQAIEHVRRVPLVDYAYLMDRLQPLGDQYDRDSAELTKLTEQIHNTDAEREKLGKAARLIIESNGSLERAVAKLRPQTESVEELHNLFLQAVAFRSKALELLVDFAESGDTEHLLGELGYRSVTEKSNSALEQFLTKRENFEQSIQ